MDPVRCGKVMWLPAAESMSHEEYVSMEQKYCAPTAKPGLLQLLSATITDKYSHTNAGALDPSGPYGSQLNPMGFHEGARRVIKCDGGYIKGFDAYMSHLGGFAEPTLNALRVVCSSSRLLLEYETGSLPDTLVFGNLPPEVQPVKGGHAPDPPWR